MDVFGAGKIKTMKKSPYILSLLALLTLWACSPSNYGSMDTPEATFNTLRKAIADRDLEMYTRCWHPDRKEREGMVSKLKDKPERWDELNGFFKGKVTIGEMDRFERDGKKMCKMQIEAPDADGGGLGGVTMINVDGKWLMYGW